MMNNERRNDGLTLYFNERLEELSGYFWTTLEDVVADIYHAFHAEVECDVLDATREYVVVGWVEDDEDVQWEIKLGGTERTITIESFEEVYRG